MIYISPTTSFSANLKLPNGQFSLEYTPHAILAASEDKFGTLDRPKFIDTSKAELVQVEVEKDKIQKLVYNVKMSDTITVALVVIPLTKMWVVKTMWGIYNG